MNIFIKKIALILFKILTPLNKIIPKDRRKIVFYSNLGFRDNAKAVYDYIIEKRLNETYKIFCCINDKKDFTDNAPKGVVMTGMVIGIWHFLTARYFFYSFGKFPIRPSKKQVVVNLWHGSPLKRIGNMIDGEKRDENYFTYLIAASEFFAGIMRQSFSCREEQVVLCGHPRNDELFGQNNIDFFDKTQKTVIWLPTFRNSRLCGWNDLPDQKTETGIPVLTTKQAMNGFNDTLKELGVMFIIKLHHAQNLDEIDMSEYSNIKILTNDDLLKHRTSLYQLLSASDALITDYSSVYFDYLLLDRPIAFTVDDMDAYGQNRGFVFDNPLDFMPGEKIENAAQLSSFMHDICAGNDKYRSERARVNGLANHFKDDQNCRRILEIAGIITNGELL